jgi:hypothetical protein
LGPSEEERVIGVERWAEIRRMHRVERVSIRDIHRRTGLHRGTIRRALVADEPPHYERAAVRSKLDPLRPWIEEQLRADPRIPSKRLRELARELGYGGGKTIFDDYVREVRPRYLVRRAYQRTIYRPGERVEPVEHARGVAHVGGDLDHGNAGPGERRGEGVAQVVDRELGSGPVLGRLRDVAVEVPLRPHAPPRRREQL